MSSAGFNEQNAAARAAEMGENIAREPEAEALQALDRLMEKPDSLTIDVMRHVMDAAPAGGPVQQKAAANLLTLSFSLAGDPYRAAQICWFAAEKLPPGSPSGQAALDRVLDIADKEIQLNELALTFLRMAAARVEPRTPLAVRGQDAWLRHIADLDKNPKLDETRDMSWRAAPGSELEQKAVALWSSTVRDDIENGHLDTALAEVRKVIVNSDTKGLLEQAANSAWQSVIEKYMMKNPDEALIKACFTNKSVYDANHNPAECAAIKEIIAETLLDLFHQTINPAYACQAVFQAAQYRGDNEVLHGRIAHHLILTAHGAPEEEQRKKAESLLDSHFPFGGNEGHAPSPTMF